MRRKIAGLAAALALFCAGSAQALTRGGTFTFGAFADVIFFDPVYQQQTVDIWFALNIYDTLLQPTPDGKSLQPGLASSYELSPDGLTMTLVLRPGIKFSDGSPILASDVKFTLERGQTKEQGGNYYFLLAAVDTIDAVGNDKVVIHFKRPDPTFPQILASFYTAVVPEKQMKAAPGNTYREKARAFSEHPVGSGPFVLSSWTHGSGFTLTRNPYYWRQGEDGKPLPYLDQVKVQILPDDATRILKLKAGEINGVEFVPFSRAAELKADPKINMTLIPAAKIVYLGMNIRPTLKDGSKNPLADKRLRQALNYAVEKKAVAQIVTYGMGALQLTLPPASTPLAMTDKGEPYPYNPEKAKALMKEAGLDNGVDLSIYALAGNADDTAELAAIQQMWAPLGVRLKILLVDAATRVAKYRADDFQMRTATWTNDINDPSQIVSYMAYFPAYESNRSGFNDAELNSLFEKSQAETDVAKRAALYRRIQEIYVDAAPMVFLLDTPYAVALDKKTQGFLQLPLGNYMFQGIHIEP
jgi:peptide/nickel transport system substrate-binding protein